MMAHETRDDFVFSLEMITGQKTGRFLGLKEVASSMDQNPAFATGQPHWQEKGGPQQRGSGGPVCPGLSRSSREPVALRDPVVLGIPYPVPFDPPGASARPRAPSLPALASSSRCLCSQRAPGPRPLAPAPGSPQPGSPAKKGVFRELWASNGKNVRSPPPPE